MNVRGDVVQRVDDLGGVLHSYRYTAFGVEMVDARVIPPEEMYAPSRYFVNWMHFDAGSGLFTEDFAAHSNNVVHHFALCPNTGELVPVLELEMHYGALTLTSNWTKELTPGATYILSFDYWSSADTDEGLFVYGLRCRNGGWSWQQEGMVTSGVGTEVRSVRVEVSSYSQELLSAITCFQVSSFIGSVFISNIRFFNKDRERVVGISDNPFRFASMYWDSETQTYMTPNRLFSPRLGRWTQPDPFWGLHNMQNCVLSIMQAGNLYMYTIHNPVRFIDPSGLQLVLSNNEAEREEQLRLLQMLTDDPLTVRRTGNWLSGIFIPRVWEVNINKTKGAGSELSAGTALIRSLIDSPHRTTFDFISENHRDQRTSAVASNWANSSTPGVGSNSRVRLNTRISYYSLVEGNAGSVLAYTPLHIVLGHELIHAYRHTRGLTVRGVNVYHEFTYRGILFNQPTSVEELQTIGLRHMQGNGSFWNPSSARFTENALRAEHGLPLRIAFDRP